MKSDKDKNEIQKVADNIISSVNYLPNTGILVENLVKLTT